MSVIKSSDGFRGTNEMKVIILAAGEGKRLRPYTIDKPKCMVKLDGKAIIDRMVTSLIKVGVKKQQITIVTGYKHEKLKYLDINEIYNYGFQSTNMLYSLMCARDVIKSGEDLLILYSDIVLSHTNYKTLLKRTAGISLLSNRNWEKLWRVRMENPLDDLESFKVSRSGRLLEIGGKLKSFNELHGQFMGVVKIHRSIATAVLKAYEELKSKSHPNLDTFNNMYMTDFLQYLIYNGFEMDVEQVDGGWLEVDTVNDLKTYNDLIKRGEIEQF